MADRREQILTRLDTLLAAIPGVRSYDANRDDAMESDRPAVRLFDGDEQAADLAEGSNHPPEAPNLVTMTPEIHVAVDVPRKETRAELSRLRREIIKAVAFDDDLAAIVGTNGAISYDGCATGFARGRSFQGEMMLAFTFTYPLKPEEL